MKFQVLFQKTKKLLVTSALALVAFLAAECPNPQPDPTLLNISKVTINGTSLNLKDANAVQENIPLEPTIVVTFDKAVTLDDVKAKVKIAKQADNQNVAVEITKNSDGVFTILLSAGAALSLNTDYLVTIEKDLSATVDGTTYTLSQTLSLKFKTLTQNNDASLNVEYSGTTVTSSKNKFTVVVSNGTNLQNISLKLTVATSAKLFFGSEETAKTLTDNAITQTFNFQDGQAKSFRVVSEDGVTAVTYSIVITDVTYTVTFDSKAGSNVAFQTIARGEKAVEPTDPTKSGYTFAGWYKEEALTNKFIFTNEVIMEDITLYARWINKNAPLTLSISGKVVAFTDYAATVNLPYGESILTAINYTDLSVASGTTAKDANKSGNPVLTSEGTLQVTENALRILITSEDGTSMQTYTITLTTSDKPTVIFYTGADTLGQAIKDEGLKDFVVATVTSVSDKDYTIKLGNITLTKTASSGKFTLMKNELRMTTATDGAPLTIKYGSAAALSLAYYKPENIYSWQDLQAMRVNLLGDYELMKDIIFPSLNEGGLPPEGFEPVGPHESAFMGTLDGNGKVVQGLKIKRTRQNYVGLFGEINHEDAEASVVQDLILRDASIEGTINTGSVAGQLTQGKIQRVGLIGNSTVVGGRDNYIGGLVGDNRGTVIGYATGSVNGNSQVGGLVGVNYGKLTGYATGMVTGTGENIGGLAGENYDKLTGYATGKVTGINTVGGLVGLNNGTAIGYARGNVTRSSGSLLAFGALIGNNSTESGGVTASGYTSTAQGESTISGNGLTINTATGEHGTPITIGETSQTNFSEFTFETGSWIWRNGKWPAIDLGTLKPFSEQP